LTSTLLIVPPIGPSSATSGLAQSRIAAQIARHRITSKPERQAGHERTGRTVPRPRELRPDARVPHPPRCELIPNADLHTDDVVITTAQRLLREHVGDERGARVLWRTDWIARTDDEHVSSIALGRACIGQELVRCVAVQAEPSHRFRDDALHRNFRPMRRHVRWKVDVEPHTEGREYESFLIQVVERSQTEV